MTEAAPRPGLRGMTMRRGLRMVLGVQALIALLLVLSDVDTRWLPGWPADETLPRGPVHPGDQVRHYEPSQTRPSYTDPAAMPGFELPDDLPERLDFSVREAGDSGEVLLLYGGIEPGDAQRFDAYLSSLDGLSMPVALNSPGGVVDEALAIGRMLREREARTVVLPGMVCLSACPYILASGSERRVSRQGAVGLHQHYYEAPRLLPVFWAVEDIQRGQGRTMEYLIEMGIDPGVMVHALKTPPAEIYVLVENQLLESGFATEVID